MLHLYAPQKDRNGKTGTCHVCLDYVILPRSTYFFSKFVYLPINYKTNIQFGKVGLRRDNKSDLGSFASQSSGQLDVLLLDGNSLCVDGTQVGVFEKGDQVGFDGFL